MANNLKLALEIELEGNEAVIRGLDGTRVAIGRLGEETDSSTGAQKRNTETTRQQQAAFGELAGQARQLRQVLAALGVAALGRELFQVNAQAQASQAALRTLTGSVSEAAVVWGRLLDFASQTPFNLEQSIDAFRALKSRGLDPGIDALTAYADFAAAMGRDLTQFVEAVADAATGEMERLKEFGVTASQQGEQVAFTFQGVTTVVERNAQAIEGYLQGIARSNFGGAAAGQMETLSGQASNLGDNITKLALAIGNAGANDLFATALSGLSSAVEAVTARVDDLGPVITIVAAAIGTRLVTAAAGAAAGMLSTASAAGILRGALALLGGPAGVVALAVGALAGYIATLETTAERTARLARETEQSGQRIGELSRLQAQSRLIDLRGQIQETTDALVSQARTIETLEREAANPGRSAGQREQLREDVIQLRAQEEELQRILARQTQTYRDLSAVAAGTYQTQQEGAKGAADAARVSAEAIAGVVAAQRERLAASNAELEAMRGGQAVHAEFLVQRRTEEILAEQLKALGVDRVDQLGAEGDALRAVAEEIARAEAAVSSYGKGAAKAGDDGAAAAKRHREELQRIIDTANPLEARQRELIAQIARVDEAIGRETGSTRELQRAKQALERQLTALRTPMASVTEAHNKSIEALRAELTAIRGGEAAYEDYLAQRRIEEDAQQRINDLLAQGHELRQQDKDAIYEQSRAEEQLRGQIDDEKKAREDANRAWEAFITEIVGAFIDSADSIGEVWADLFGRLKRELINSGVAALFGFEQGSTPLMSGLGQLLGIGGAAPAGGGAGVGGGGFSVSSLLSGGRLFPGVEANILAATSRLAMQGGIAGQIGLWLNNAANTLAGAPGGLAGGSILSAGAGMLTTQLLGGGQFSQLGGGVGGIAGAAALSQLGWAAGPLGAVAGAAIGAALDKVFGGDGPETRAAVFVGQEGVGRAEPKHTVASTTGASGLVFAGEAQRVGEQGRDAIKALTEQFTAIDQALTALTRGAGFDVDLSATTAFGKGEFAATGDAARDFVRNWIDAVSAPFDDELRAAAGALVGDTAEDLINAYQALLIVRDDLRQGGSLFGGLGSLSEISAAISPQEIQRVAAFGAQLRTLQDSMSSDRIAAWEQSQRSVFELWRDQGDAIVRAADVAATEQDFALLQAAVQDRYQTEMELIGQIMGALESSASRFAATYESIFIDGLKTEEERYNYFRAQADAIAETITTLNDPGEIDAAAERYDNLLKQAYQALGEGSRDAMRDEILQTIDEVSALVEQRLQSALDAVAADGDAGTPGSVASAVQGATEAAIAQLRDTMAASIEAMARQQEAAASAQQRAADVQLAAAGQFGAWVARLPSSIQVQLTGSEVAF